MNAPSPVVFRESLAACLGVATWVDTVTERGPYRSADELLGVARDEASALRAAEVGEALTRHAAAGRIGEPVIGSGRAQDLARRERESLDADAEDGELAAALARGNLAYEERFGRTFIVRAAGRTLAEIITELHRRLELDDDAEFAALRHELGEIAAWRLRALVEDEGWFASGGPVPDAGAPGADGGAGAGAGDRHGGSRVTTQIMDSTTGAAAYGMAVGLAQQVDHEWNTLATAVSDEDGRVDAIGPEELPEGLYRLTFATGDYFEERGGSAFFPEVQILFVLPPEGTPCHIPLLVGPSAFSTHRED